MIRKVEIDSRSSWIVPRRSLCAMFWVGIALLFSGIVLVVTSKHKKHDFQSWGSVLLGLGLCMLVICLVLCLHAYCVIARRDHLEAHPKVEPPRVDPGLSQMHARLMPDRSPATLYEGTRLMMPPELLNKNGASCQCLIERDQRKLTRNEQIPREEFGTLLQLPPFQDGIATPTPPSSLIGSSNASSSSHDSHHVTVHISNSLDGDLDNPSEGVSGTAAPEQSEAYLKPIGNHISNGARGVLADLKYQLANQRVEYSLDEPVHHGILPPSGPSRGFHPPVYTGSRQPFGPAWGTQPQIRPSSKSNPANSRSLEQPRHVLPNGPVYPAPPRLLPQQNHVTHPGLKLQNVSFKIDSLPSTSKVELHFRPVQLGESKTACEQKPTTAEQLTKSLKTVQPVHRPANKSNELPQSKKKKVPTATLR